MKITARLNYLRVAPRKVRLVANAVRGKSVPEAERALRFLTRRAAGPLEKLLRSAVANARANYRIASPHSLTISAIRVDGGPVLKRRRPRARGLAFPIRKRTSHVELVLETTEKLRAPPRVRKAGIAILRGEGKAGGDEPAKAPADRDLFRERPKVATKPREFIRRVFRRKAI